MGSYRSRLHIIADVLCVARSGAKKTQIMYRSNLSYKLLTKYLIQTLEAGLVCFDHEKQCYVITPVGEEFLEIFKGYSRGNKHIERELNDVKASRKVLEGLCTSKRGRMNFSNR